MTSDVGDLTTFYANLPSIFESDPLTSIQSSSTPASTITDHAKTYQPMFGLFQFAESEPFTNAAFIGSSSASKEMTTVPEQRTDENQTEQANNNQHQPSTPDEEISDIDDDDFDGIPLRPADTMMRNESIEVSDLISHESTHPIGSNPQNNEDELFLNGFTDEEHQQLRNDLATGPSIFKNIPDIDDLNEYEEQDNDKVPFDPVDLLDQSDSVRSSSPDSLLSSSHLLDDDDENNNPEEDMNNNSNNPDDDIAQWNDAFLLQKPTVPNAPSLPPLVLDTHPQVDFIDSSRSNSRCSDASSHLSFGYTDQARIIMNDDELQTSTDSDSDNDDERINFQDDTSIRSYHSDDLPLEINLDYHRRRASSYSSSSQQISTRSTSPIPDQSPIVDMDEVPNEIGTTVHLAPIALVEEENDDDDEDDDPDLPTSNSDQPVLSVIPMKSHIDPQNELARDIINMRQLLENHDDDEEFLAVMHSPNVFEDVLHDDDEHDQKLHLVKQTNVDSSASHTSPQLANDNETESESFEQYQIIQQTSSLSVSNNKKNSPSNITTTNNRSPGTSTPVNHPLIGKENVAAISSSRIKQEKEQQWQGEQNIANNNSEQTAEERQKDDYHKMMDSDEESENDLELLNTLAQLHGLVHTPRIASEIDRNRLNETEVFDRRDDEESNNLSKLVSLSKQDEKKDLLLPTDDGDGDRQTKNDYPTSEKKKPSTFFSFTSLTSSGLYNDDQSPSTDIILDSDTSSSLLTSINELNNSILSSNRVITDDLPVKDSKDNDLWNQSTPILIETSAANDLRDYLYWIIDHLNNDDVQSAMENLESVHPIVNSTECHVLSDSQLEENNADNPSDQQVEQLVDQIVSEAIYEVYNEENSISQSLINENDQANLTNETSFDPFDQNFDCFWTSHFEIPDDIRNQNNRPVWTKSNLCSTASNQGTTRTPLSANPFDSTITADDFVRDLSATSVRYANNGEKSLYKNEPPTTTDSKDLPVTEPQAASEIPPASATNENDDSSTTDSDDEDDDNTKKEAAENFFVNGARSSQFEAFASDQPLHTSGLDSLTADLDNEFDGTSQVQEFRPSTTEQSSETKKSPGDAEEEPWELEDSGEERTKPVASTSIHKNDSYNNFFVETVPTKRLSQQSLSLSTSDESEDKEHSTEKENYDDYFPKQEPVENTEPNELRLSKSVRFDEKLENVAVLTPKDSLEQSEVSTSDSDEIDNEDILPTFRVISDRISDHIDDQKPTNEETTEATMHDITHELQSHISIAESVDLPPPLPPLPPLNKKSSNSNDNLRSKSALSPSTTTDAKRKINGRSEPEIAASIPTATTDAHLLSNTDTKTTRSFDSAILRSASRDAADVDSDEIDGVISCMIDSNQITIDAKTISPFKCVITSAGQLQEANQAAVIAIYGCWLPDRRLREYRYIMDQLFYYVYHKLEELVTDEYVLVYFHGATPKHRTPELKFLRKYYQMINFRLRKNLRAVYVVHPTRWLRTVIALFRPFFSKKFYHKVHYVFTIAELERLFPHNHVSIPVIIEQTDWLYSQTYDRRNASIKRSIEQSASRSIGGIDNESSA